MDSGVGLRALTFSDLASSVINNFEKGFGMGTNGGMAQETEDSSKSISDVSEVEGEKVVCQTEEFHLWKVGQRDLRNEEIRNICGQRESFIVYFVKGGWLNWFYDSKVIKGAHRLEADAQILLNRGKSWIRDPRVFGEFRNIVASGMVHGLSNLEDGGDHDGCFTDAESFLKIRSKASYQIVFVLAALVSAITIGGVLFVLSIAEGVGFELLHRHLFLGGAGGAYGALLSMLIRAQRLETDLVTFNASTYVVLEAFIRVLLGVSFGFLMVLLQKSGLVLHLADNNPYFIGLGAIVAGFNERIVPALLADLENVYGSRSSD